MLISRKIAKTSKKHQKSQKKHTKPKKKTKSENTYIVQHLNSLTFTVPNDLKLQNAAREGIKRSKTNGKNLAIRRSKEVTPRERCGERRERTGVGRITSQGEPRRRRRRCRAGGCPYPRGCPRTPLRERKRAGGGKEKRREEETGGVRRIWRRRRSCARTRWSRLQHSLQQQHKHTPPALATVRGASGSCTKGSPDETSVLPCG
jgi:hypothetical protein